MTNINNDDISNSPLNDMSVGELLDLLRRIAGESGSMEKTSEPNYEAVEAINERTRIGRVHRVAVLEMLGASPPKIQLEFLDSLANYEEARNGFMKDPVGYSKEAGVLLDERFVSAIVDLVVFDKELQPDFAAKYGKDVAARLAELHNPGTAAWPAAVAAIAAVVAAGAAVVQAVTSVMKDHSAGDLMRLKGLGAQGVNIKGLQNKGPLIQGGALVGNNPNEGPLGGGGRRF